MSNPTTTRAVRIARCALYAFCLVWWCGLRVHVHLASNIVLSHGGWTLNGCTGKVCKHAPISHMASSVPEFNERISASVVLCATEDCKRELQDIGAPLNRKQWPEVERHVSRQFPKLASVHLVNPS